ncbi:hypothetical protein E1293_27665 [Actinomadura darangshiensis]|uniref:Uncharacterized protein n=1 Tax=Actinomadura darangshiensis TaxID=705336 RepID=A0A4R5ATT3_9ACTN|nr:hypothetical protein [Actinomadura darangshiensis]TDD75805.1 hypothetical protein E1293_27665 [Actinomadura darangshiensis]
MTIEMLLAALIGGAIGLAELVARYRDKPVAALLSPGGLLFVFVNAGAAIVALIVVTASGWTFGLPETTAPASLLVVRVIAAAVGSAAVLRTSFAPASSGAAGTGPVALLNGILRIADGELERKRALSRLSHNDLTGLSFERDHAALAELCCHLMREFDLAEAQRLGGLAAELSSRDDLTDADKLDCWGLELTRLVGERALRQAARRLRDRPRDEPRPAEAAQRPAAPAPEHEPLEPAPPRPSVAKTSRLAASTNGRTERKSFSDV